ncbi:MAG TPA: hypothetical protein VEV45_12275 [Streptosporangiaceae bacterium]|nr:hypothetical protein [Streptosporangiaceae bacterium]
MVVVAVVAVVAAVGFGLILAVVLLVIIGVHQEERRLTFARQRAPTPAARLARLIVGRYVRPVEPEPQADGRTAPVPATPGEPTASPAAPGRSAA